MNWFKKAQIMERFASTTSYSRVKAQDYIRLMRLVDKKPPGLPATDEMRRLLNKMAVDLEDAVANVYINTIAAGHTSNGMMYPCPDCYGNVNSLDDIFEAWESRGVLTHYWKLEDYIETEYYGEDPEDVPIEIREAFEKSNEGRTYGGDGIFICETCGDIKQADDLDQYMMNPFPGGREFLISDQIDMIVNHLKKFKEAETFERKFPWFEGIIEWIHGSGDMSRWFIEGGSNTIDKYRSSKLPSQYKDEPYGSWIHPHYRDKDWDWSNI
jgi:hypothetical protein